MEESLRHPENPILETKKYLRPSLTDHARTGHNSSAEQGEGSGGFGIITANICRYCLTMRGFRSPIKWTQVLPYKQTVSGKLGDLLSLLLFLMDA